MHASQISEPVIGDLREVWLNDLAPHVCLQGHLWGAKMFWELGGWFYVNEDDPGFGPWCPVCRLEMDDDRSTEIAGLEQLLGFNLKRADEAAIWESLAVYWDDSAPVNFAAPWMDWAYGLADEVRNVMDEHDRPGDTWERACTYLGLDPDV